MGSWLVECATEWLVLVDSESGILPCCLVLLAPPIFLRKKDPRTRGLRSGSEATWNPESAVVSGCASA